MNGGQKFVDRQSLVAKVGNEISKAAKWASLLNSATASVRNVRW